MIYHPIIYHRDFQNDFPKLNSQKTLWQSCQRVALAILPVATLYRPFRGIISLSTSCIRSITHTQEMLHKKSVFALLNTSLAVTSVALFFLNPVFSYLAISCSDLSINSKEFIEHLRSGKYSEALKAFAYMSLNTLFLTSICYGTLEVTIACMILQIALELLNMGEHFKNGRYLEGITQAILACVHTRQTIPQLKLYHWMYTQKPVLSAILKQNKAGFVYLDLPDEYAYSLYELFKETGMKLPPYFGKGRAGAHISVIHIEELQNNKSLVIDSIGKRFNFQIVNVDTVFPGFNKSVHILTLSSPELEVLRIRHGFSPKITSHDFHTTFANS